MEARDRDAFGRLNDDFRICQRGVLEVPELTAEVYHERARVLDCAHAPLRGLGDVREELCVPVSTHPIAGDGKPLSGGLSGLLLAAAVV